MSNFVSPVPSGGRKEPFSAPSCPRLFSTSTGLMLSGHGLVGLVLDLHDLTGFLVPLGHRPVVGFWNWVRLPQNP
jgi:hypothetical protein